MTDYPLGHSADEETRLADQAALVEAQTEDLFRRAGIAPGMRVLDVGSGVGDVSLLLARMVGSGGSVLGIEKASSSVDTARRRIADLGLANVLFEEADLAKFTTGETFDAVVGRFVLAYVPDRAAALARLTGRVKRSGIVAFQEIDMSQIAQVPPSALFTQARQWMLEAFAAGGAELDMGTKLYATFLAAGLPEPDMFAATPVVGGPRSAGYDQIISVLRSLLPVIEREEIADVASIGLDALAKRLRDDAEAHDRVLFMSRLVGAWTRV